MAKILIVDDSPFMRERLKELLEDRGHSTLQAKNGLEAIDMYKTHRPDLVFMDITMPEMEGIVALERILEIDPNAKIVMLSALGQREIVMSCIQKGAKTFITKPLKVGSIVEVLTRILGKS